MGGRAGAGGSDSGLARASCVHIPSHAPLIRHAMMSHPESSYPPRAQPILHTRNLIRRVVVGKEYYEAAGLEPELPVEAALGCILQQKVALTRPVGAMLPSSQFPTSYFAVGGVEQWWDTEFLAIMDDMSGGKLRVKGEEPDYWRFNRIHGGLGRGWGGAVGGVWGEEGETVVSANITPGSKPPVVPMPQTQIADYGPARMEDPNSLSVALGLMRPIGQD